MISYPNHWGGTFSEEKVEQRSRVSADLLRVCAFLAPDAIAEEIILQGASHLGPSLALVAGDEVVLDEAVAPLLAYSLIRRNVKEKTFSMHRLVQVVLKDAMDEQTRKQWGERIVQAVNEAFPEVEFETWPQCERCLPHALVCADLIAQGLMTMPQAASVLCKAGSYLIGCVRFKEAEWVLRQSLDIGENHLGKAHPETANSLSWLARLFQWQGKDAEAESLLKRALSIYEEQLGPTHPSTATGLNNLSLLYSKQGKSSENGFRRGGRI